MQSKQERIFVGLSGGVDSAVTAALLKKQGHEVVGVFIKGWYPEGMPCTWREDRRDAMRVAAHLRIPFTTLDASKEYKTAVLQYLVQEYGVGRTPNPDILCNREVKFGVFYQYAKSKGANGIATGHYALQKEGKLFRGKDPTKDQSYFLWAVPLDALRYSRFPLGEMQKTEVRTLAKEFALPVANKKDSQGICFLGPVSVEDFLIHEFGLNSGEAYDEDGNTIGTHQGALLHTLGERIALENAPSGPWFVLRKDIAKNILVVGKTKERREAIHELHFNSENWLSTVSNEQVVLQYRYHGPRIPGTLKRDEHLVRLARPLRETPASGQSLVFYKGEECLGGGIIS